MGWVERWKACPEQQSSVLGGEPKGETRGAVLTLNLLVSRRDPDTLMVSECGGGYPNKKTRADVKILGLGFGNLEALPLYL